MICFLQYHYPLESYYLSKKELWSFLSILLFKSEKKSLRAGIFVCHMDTSFKCIIYFKVNWKEIKFFSSLAYVPSLIIARVRDPLLGVHAIIFCPHTKFTCSKQYDNFRPSNCFHKFAIFLFFSSLSKETQKKN